jgi:hypothetical protein
VDTLFILAVGAVGAILGNAFWFWWKRRSVPRMGPAPTGYQVEIDHGKGGWVTYRERTHDARFSWKLAGKEGTLIAWVIVPTPKRWPDDVPWAPGRRDEILDRIAGELLRQRCPTCRMVIGKDSIEMHVRAS